MTTAYVKLKEMKTKVKKGWLAIAVGVPGEQDGGVDGEARRFTIPLHYLQHPLFSRLLQSAQEAYGYRTTGPLRLPCSVDEFLHIRWAIEQERQNGCAGGGCQLSLCLHPW